MSGRPVPASGNPMIVLDRDVRAQSTSDQTWLDSLLGAWPQKSVREPVPGGEFLAFLAGRGRPPQSVGVGADHPLCLTTANNQWRRTHPHPHLSRQASGLMARGRYGSRDFDAPEPSVRTSGGRGGEFGWFRRLRKICRDCHRPFFLKGFRSTASQPELPTYQRLPQETRLANSRRGAANVCHHRAEMHFGRSAECVWQRPSPSNLPQLRPRHSQNQNHRATTHRCRLFCCQLLPQPRPRHSQNQNQIQPF